ncbi:MAG: hypothetical protein IJP29_07925 [Lachnospiraceae bacterium]|nr:hypothetical protein [Lachnospiraceae bacterium]
MELGGFGFEKPELMKIAEEIYSLRHKRQGLELELTSEEFHQSYIPQRRNLAKGEVFQRFALIIPITAMLIGCVIYSLYYVINGAETRQSGADGVILLFAALFLAFGGYTDVLLIKRQIYLMRILSWSDNPEMAYRKGMENGVVSIQGDEQHSKNRIESLKSSVESIDLQIIELEERQKRLMAEKQRSEAFLKEKGVLFDEDPNKPQKKGAFSLKEDATGTLNAAMLDEMYAVEEKYLKGCINDLEVEIHILNKQITQLDDDFEAIKHNIIMTGCAFLFLLAIQVFLSGVIGFFTALFFAVASTAYIIYMETKCKRTVALYLIEHDNNLIKEYAFCHNLEPMHRKRSEILEHIEIYKRELADIKLKRERIVF